MNTDNAYIVAASKEKENHDFGPWKYLADNDFTMTDEERRAKRVDFGEARYWVSIIEKINGYKATYFVASEFK
jgi:hypothetical protein